MSSAAEIYALELSSRGHGLPLWIPEPTESGEVLIGDVGYVWRGAFYRLFNVTRSRDDPINKNDVPDDFKVLQYAPQARHTINGYVHDALCSRTVRSTGAQAKLSADLAPAGLGYKFTCTADRGAALVMKDAGILEEVHASGSFEEYFKQHHNNWIAFATKIGLTLTLEDFLLVRGCIKTTAWAVAAFMGGNNAHELSFRADAASFANAEFSVSRSVGVDPAIERRVGPLAASSKLFIPGQPAYANGENTSYDQCIFLHALKCKRRLLFNGIRIRAAAEPRDESFTDQFPPTPDSIGWKTSEERFSEEYEFEGSYSVNCRTAVDDVLDYILENSEAELAIASDLEVRILNSIQVDHTDLPAEDHTLGYILSHANPFRIEVDNTGVGTLVPLDEEPCDDSDAGVTLAEYRIGKSLANHEDSLAHVHLAQSVQTGRTCAIKIIQKQKIVDLGQSMYIRRGLQALRAAQSPFVVQYFTAFQDHDHLFVVTDYVSEVSLHHLLQRFTKLSEHIARFYAAELVSAISFLHGHNVVHGALNPRNCLIAASGHIKLCGFTYAYPSASSPQPLCYDKATFHYLQNYIAPEVLRDELVTPPADWYALGAMLYQMLVGWTPKNIDKLARFLSEYSQPVQDVVLSLLSAEPFMRNGIGKLDLRGHTWFSGIDWDEVEGCRLEPLYKPICDEEFDFPSQQIEFPSMEPPLNDSYAGSFPDFKYRPRKFSMAHAPKIAFSPFSFRAAGQGLFSSQYTPTHLHSEPATAEVSSPGRTALGTIQMTYKRMQPPNDLWMDVMWKASIVAY